MTRRTVAEPRYVRRFGPGDRVQHLVLVVTFLGLSATGLPLLFSDAAWARPMARLVGGFGVTGILHRLFAAGLIGLFIVHVGAIAVRVLRGERGMLWGPTSLVPQPRDVVELYRHVLWFLRRGPKPAFDRYTYWEKFDYMAVFWGMVIIGGSGLMLWFPELFALVLPGWVFNVALLIHGEEALLAVGFIVTIHFFNSHMRPQKFPMDLVMFTGVVPEEEYARDRPLEYARLQSTSGLEARLAPPPDPTLVSRARRGGFAAIAAGLILFLLVVFAVLSR
jgi:cytochrome b subunit of formate dehydrogenase